MRHVNMPLILPLCVLALSGCATQAPPLCQPVEVPPPKLAPPPADVMVERPANFRERLLAYFQTKPVNSLSISRPTLTTLPASLQPASR